jgi:hypothetical protein
MKEGSKSEYDECYYKIQDEAIKEAFDQLPFIIQIFHSQIFDIKKSVENGLDFLLGGQLQP